MTREANQEKDALEDEEIRRWDTFSLLAEAARQAVAKSEAYRRLDAALRNLP